VNAAPPAAAPPMDRPRRKRARPAGPADDSAEVSTVLSDYKSKEVPCLSWY
jgi:hypothetical protein